MAGALVDVQLDDRELRGLVDKLLAKTRNPSPLLKDIGEEALIQTEQRFEREEDPDGRAWTPLKIRTLYSSFRGKRYTRRGKVRAKFGRYLANRKILTRTGQLRKSMSYRVDRGSVQWGTSKKYGAVHQFGADFSILKTRAHIKIPARPYLGVNDANMRRFIDIVKDHLERA